VCVPGIDHRGPAHNECLSPETALADGDESNEASTAMISRLLEARSERCRRALTRALPECQHEADTVNQCYRLAQEIMAPNVT
jgi:hypothetical protein